MKRLARYFKNVAVVFAVAIVSATSLPIGQSVSAATSSSGLGVTPRKNFTIEAGKTVNDKLIIRNLNKQAPLVLSLQVIDFTFADETGTPKLNVAKNAPQTTWSLRPFIKLPESVTIEAGGSKSIDYSISIPANQGAGSYYSAIQYSSGSSEGGNVNLSASGVTLAFVSVPGVVDEKMTLQKFGAFQRDASGAGGEYLDIAFANSPTTLAYTLKNEGNVAESPAGGIILKDMFGNQVASIDKANPNSWLALIGQTRRFEACIKSIEKKVDLEGSVGTTATCDKTSLKPGRYTASMELYYGQNGNQSKEITTVASFWYLPLWFLLAVAAVVLAIVYFIWRIKRKIQGSREVKRRSILGLKRR